MYKYQFVLKYDCCCLVSKSYPTLLRLHGLCRSMDCQLGPWDLPGKNIGVGCHVLLHGNLPGPGIKPMSPSWQADSLSLSYQGSTQV